MRLSLLLPATLCLLLFACKEKQKSATTEQKAAPIVPLKVEDTTQTYFSIRDYLNEQWNLKKDNPYTLLKIVIANGKRDSAFVPFDSANWFAIMKPFYIADIGDKKYLGWYRFDSFEDEAAEEMHIHYEAIAPDTIMRKMDIAANRYSGMVNLVYMETRQKANNEIITRKMTYKRDDFIQVVESEKEEGKPAVQRVIEHRFKY
jgi:hypothetical protein